MIPQMLKLAATAAKAAKAAKTVQTVMKVAQVGSTVLGAAGALKSGSEAKAYGKAQQDALLAQALGFDQQATVASGNTAITIGRMSADGARVAGEQQAGAAGSGFEFGDQTSVNVATGIAATTRVQQLLEQARGDDERAGLEYQASAARLQGAYALQAGKRAKQASYLKAGATVLEGAVQYRDRFGGAKPAPSKLPKPAPGKSKFGNAGYVATVSPSRHGR